MAPNLENSKEGPKTIRIFLASPSDVEEERDVLSALIREVNDVLAFLVPDRALRLELVRYETHTYPDMGRAQDVINRQIPIDYEIFVGVMWKRVGTPTANSPSGTIEEFRRALAHRQSTGRPVIMFYFCDEQVPFPRGEDLDQLQKVVQFRDELSSIGYTLSYPKRTEFRDHVRGGILRAIADLLGGSIKSVSLGITEPSSAAFADEDRDSMAELASQYDEVRRTMSPGSARTQVMIDRRHHAPQGSRCSIAVERVYDQQFRRLPSCWNLGSSTIPRPISSALARGKTGSRQGNALRRVYCRSRSRAGGPQPPRKGT